MLFFKQLAIEAPDRFERVLARRRRITTRLSSLPGVAVHDLQTVAELTHELTHYKDLIHFDLTVNDRLLSIVAGGRERVDGVDIDRANALLRAQVAQYELPAGFVRR